MGCSIANKSFHLSRGGSLARASIAGTLLDSSLFHQEQYLEEDQVLSDVGVLGA